MKKIIIILLAAVLLAGGLGGFAYAQSTHEVMTGQKLLGTGGLGSMELPGGIRNGWWAAFLLTNPDSVGEITIERISIVREDGTVIYEGPLLQQILQGGEVVQSIELTDPLEPHAIHEINLQFYMPDPDDPEHEWMSIREARLLPWAKYTVEVFWKGSHKKGLPLIGWAYMQRGFLDGEGYPLESDEGIPVGVVTGFGTQMVNMRQKLMPEG